MKETKNEELCKIIPITRITKQSNADTQDMSVLMAVLEEFRIMDLMLKEKMAGTY